MKACSSTSDQFFLFAQDLRLRPELPEHVLGLLLLLLDVGLGLLLLQLRTPRVIEWPSDISRVLVVRIEVYDALDGGLYVAAVAAPPNPLHVVLEPHLARYPEVAVLLGNKDE